MDKDPTIWKKELLRRTRTQKVLGADLWGNSLEDFNSLEAVGSTFKDIVDNLEKIYDKTPHINDYRSEEITTIKPETLT